MFHILNSPFVLSYFSASAFEFMNLPLENFLLRNEFLDSTFIGTNFHAVLLSNLSDLVLTLAAASFQVFELQSLGL